MWSFRISTLSPEYSPTFDKLNEMKFETVCMYFLSDVFGLLTSRICAIPLQRNVTTCNGLVGSSAYTSNIFFAENMPKDPSKRHCSACEKWRHGQEYIEMLSFVAESSKFGSFSPFFYFK